jgi:hypothetical protein
VGAATKLHRGWTVLGAAAVGVFMTVPGQTVGVSAFVDPLAILPRNLGRTEGINSHRWHPEIRADGLHNPLDFAVEQSVCVVVK